MPAAADKRNTGGRRKKTPVPQPVRHTTSMCVEESAAAEVAYCRSRPETKKHCPALFRYRYRISVPGQGNHLPQAKKKHILCRISSVFVLWPSRAVDLVPSCNSGPGSRAGIRNTICCASDIKVRLWSSPATSSGRGQHPVMAAAPQYPVQGRERHGFGQATWIGGQE